MKVRLRLGDLFPLGIIFTYFGLVFLGLAVYMPLAEILMIKPLLWLFDNGLTLLALGMILMGVALIIAGIEPVKEMAK